MYRKYTENEWQDDIGTYLLQKDYVRYFSTSAARRVFMDFPPGLRLFSANVCCTTGGNWDNL